MEVLIVAQTNVIPSLFSIGILYKYAVQYTFYNQYKMRLIVCKPHQNRSHM